MLYLGSVSYLCVFGFDDLFWRQFRAPHPVPSALAWMGQRDPELNPATPAGLARYDAGPAEFLHSLRHVQEAVMPWLRNRLVKPLAVVRHRHHQSLAVPANLQQHLGGLGMLD